MLAIVGTLVGMLGGGVAARSIESCDADTGTWHVCAGGGGQPIAGAAVIRNDNTKGYGVILVCVPEGDAGHLYLLTQTGANSTFKQRDLGAVPTACPFVI